MFLWFLVFTLWLHLCSFISVWMVSTQMSYFCLCVFTPPQLCHFGGSKEKVPVKATPLAPLQPCRSILKTRSDDAWASGALFSSRTFTVNVAVKRLWCKRIGETPLFLRIHIMLGLNDEWQVHPTAFLICTCPTRYVLYCSSSVLYHCSLMETAVMLTPRPFIRMSMFWNVKACHGRPY